MVRAFKAVLDRHVARSQIDQRRGHEEGADLAVPFLLKKQRIVCNGGKTTNARANHDASALLLFFGFGNPTRIGNRLIGGSYPE